MRRFVAAACPDRWLRSLGWAVADGVARRRNPAFDRNAVFAATAPTRTRFDRNDPRTGSASFALEIGWDSVPVGAQRRARARSANLSFIGKLKKR